MYVDVQQRYYILLHPLLCISNMTHLGGGQVGEESLNKMNPCVVSGGYIGVCHGQKSVLRTAAAGFNAQPPALLLCLSVCRLVIKFNLDLIYHLARSRLLLYSSSSTSRLIRVSIIKYSSKYHKYVRLGDLTVCFFFVLLCRGQTLCHPRTSRSLQVGLGASADQHACLGCTCYSSILYTIILPSCILLCYVYCCNIIHKNTRAYHIYTDAART